MTTTCLTEEQDLFDDEEVFVFPVSFAQQRLWFLDQFEPGSPFYNIPMAVRLNGPLDHAALERTLNEIVRRHEVLRTTFGVLDGEPMQLIAPEGHLSLPLVDLRHLPQAEREWEALRQANEEAKRPFNLTTGPLLRARLFRLDQTAYVAIFVMHHIISDGWSMGVLFGEVAAIYAAFAAERPSPLPDLPIQYADFAEWQRNWLQGDALQSQIDYWVNKLGPDLPVLELPTDRPRPAVQTSRGASLAHVLPLELVEAVKQLSQSEGTTLFMTLLAAFHTLLYRYTGQETINVGSPIANRSRAEIERLIGFFVNTLVLRADLHDELTFRQLLAQIKETTLEAYAHQDLPFENLVEALQPDRDMSHSPLFQVMFILQNAPTGGQAVSDLSLEPIDVETGTATFELTLSLGEEPGGMEVAAEYNTDLFDAATIERLLNHYQVLLAGIAADPDQSIATLPLLTEVERQQILGEWNETAVPYPTHQTIHQLFEQQVERTPGATAVVWQDQRLTYDQLNRRANQLAHYLRQRGVGPETIVAICVERSLEMIIGVLGVLKAGGAYLPLDPDYPPDRLTFMIEDAQPKLILTIDDLRLTIDDASETLPNRKSKTCAEQSRSIVNLKSNWPTIAQHPTTNLPISQSPDSLAYVIYTSGSTGQSKGVMVEHRNLVNAYFAWADAYELDRVHSHLQMANFAFDVFSGDLVRALLSGGKLVIYPRELLLDAEHLYQTMQQEQIDVAEFVPVVLRHLMQYLDKKGLDLSFMRLLACGSDNWYVGEYKKFRRFCGPETRLINSFGLTEATIDSTYFESDSLDLATEQVVPIGRPFPNTTLYILDKQRRPVPIGVPGELHVGGAGLARGYLNRPALTEERFVDLRFTILDLRLSSHSDANRQSSIVNRKWYRTGDRARWLPDSNVEFLGRLDHQVKIRGFRIEPGEIEAVLGEHPAARQVAVMPLDAPAGDKRLVAYIVASPDTPPTAGALRRFLQERLPDYMVPAAFVLLEEMPLLPNGKVNRRALPEPDWSERSLDNDYVAPRTAVEETLAHIWMQVLGVEQAGVHDNFFALGGHSLLATQLISRVRNAFEIDLPLRRIFESPTIAELGEQVEIARRSGTGTQALPITPVPRQAEMPLSFAQQRLWFLDQLEPNSPFYNIPEAVRLTGALDVAVLAQCLNEIVRRHEALRTVFPVTADGRPFQHILPAFTLPVPITDLRHLPPARREAEAMRLAAEEAARPFNLAAGPLLRARLLRLAGDDHIILLTLHHIIGDDWSTSVLVGEVGVLYEAFSNARTESGRSAHRRSGGFSPLPELPIQYADFAHWQRSWLQGETLQNHLDYWKQTLGGSPPLLALPTDRPRPPVQTFNGDFISFALPEALSTAVRQLCRQEGVTLFMTLLAAFQTLLYRYSGQDDVNVGTPIANRNRADIEGLIGFFVNTLVLRGDLSGAPGFRALLKRVREIALGAYAHQDLPFEMIVDAIQPERDLSHSPLFQVMFVIQNTPLGEMTNLPDLTLRPVEAHSGTAKFDLTLFMIEEGDQLTGAWEYNSDLFDRSTIERMAGHFERLLQGIVANPDQSITSLPLLTEVELRQILLEWNDTAVPIPDLCAHQLFEQQVERTPEATAVRFQEQTLTYDQLNQHANQLAHHLQTLGVGPESLVGLCVERSLEMVTGILGILKAGGAYLPLDPTYPPERLAFMITDAQPVVILTNSPVVESSLSQVVKSSGSQVVNLSSILPDYPTTRPPDYKTTPDSLAYVIYTSGSTGQPKGTMLLHRGLVNYLTWCLRAYPIAAGQGAPIHSSISFDLTITGLFAPLLAGRCVHLLPEDIGVDLLSSALRQHDDYSLVKITPAHLQLLSQQLTPQEAAGKTRSFIIGGENLLAEKLAFWREHAPDTLLINEYGPTETVVGCCVYTVPAGERRSGSVPIGRPVINTQLYILDDQMQPVPIGVPGELYISGAQVGRGYLNRPELTAERFIDLRLTIDDASASLSTSLRFMDGSSNRKSKIVNRQSYKTGDLCRWLPDGNIEFLGRLDSQVKIHGFRIELGEIEAVLSRHEGVRKTAVIDREDEPGRKRLVAYVAPEGEPPAASELRAFLGQTLPDYMIPSAFVILPEIPLTANGKVDRRALPAPDAARPELAAEFVAPQSAKEMILAAIWANLLGVERVGVYDNFFELGGDSILSIQVIARANQAGLRLTPRQLFQQPTIAGLAAAAGTGPAIQAEQGVVEGPVPLTPIQHWFFEQAQPEPHHWNQAILLGVEEQLDWDWLATAVSHLIAHHDALRLRFHQDETGWRQSSAGLSDLIPFQHFDLSQTPSETQTAVIEQQLTDLQASLNLEAGPLLRVAAFDLGPEQPGRIALIIHHLAVDGVSWRILLEDLLTAYRQISRGQPVQLPPKTSAFRQWAERLAEYAQLAMVQEELDWWTAVTYPPLALPRDYPDGVNDEASADSVTVSLTAEETTALLRDVHEAYRTDINDILLAALAQGMAAWTGSPALLVNLEGHGREPLFDDLDVSRTVGWFTTLYPVRLDLTGKEGPGAVLTAVKEQLRQIPNRGIGYGLLRYLNEMEETAVLRRQPRPEISFNYLGQMDQALPDDTPLGPAPESRGPDRSPQAHRTHLLEIDGGIMGGRLQLEWSFSQNCHRRERIEQAAGEFIAALRALIAHCQQPEAGGVTLSDVAEFGWEQDDLDDILAALD